MDFSRVLRALGAQFGVFVLGGLSLLALTRGLYASAGFCTLAALALMALGLRAATLRARADRLGTPPGASFTAELGRRRLQVLLDQTPSPLLLQGDDEQVIAVNRAARRLFDVAYALPTNSRKALLGGANTLAERLRQGQLHWRDHTYAASLTEISGGDHSAHLVVMTDISAELRAAEASALRDLLKVLNHELMNALTPVASMSRSALELLTDDTPQARSAAIKALERVVARTEGLGDFIGAYRTLVQLPPPALRAVDLSAWFDVLRESFTAQWATKDVVAEFSAPKEVVSVLMDEDQMWLCLGNLLNNAAEAAIEGPDRRVRLVLTASDEVVVCRLQDSGPGVASDKVDKIFMPFFTTKASGTGVGLSLSRQILQAHGGGLGLASPGPSEDLGGALFEFYWKRAPTL